MKQFKDLKVGDEIVVVYLPQDFTKKSLNVEYRKVTCDPIMWFTETQVMFKIDKECCHTDTFCPDGNSCFSYGMYCAYMPSDNMDYILEAIRFGMQVEHQRVKDGLKSLFDLRCFND